MYNRRYDKAFVMLRQEVSGFSWGQQPPWGSCTMELKNKKGKLYVTVQGLKPLHDGRWYEIFVIGGQGEKLRGISCGMLDVNAYGKGELKWEFSPDRIGESCFQAEDLHTVALLVRGQSGVLAPLAGYFQEKVQWQKWFQEDKKKGDLRAAEAICSLEEPTKTMPEVQPKEQKVVELLPPEQKIVEKTEKKIEKTGEIEEKTVKKIEEQRKLEENSEKKSSDFHKNFKDMLTKFQQELHHLEENGILSPEDKERILQGGGQNTKREKAREETDTQKPKKNTEIAYILEHNDDLIPFAEGEVWKSIALEELAVLPVPALKMMHHTFFLLAYRKYKHFIFCDKGEQGYLLGIPQVYQPLDRREAERLSCGEFRPCKGERLQAGCYGYWLYPIQGIESEQRM